MPSRLGTASALQRLQCISRPGMARSRSDLDLNSFKVGFSTPQVQKRPAYRRVGPQVSGRDAVFKSADDKQRVSRSVQQIIVRNGIPSNEWDELWFDISTDYWVQFADQQYRGMQGLQHKQISEVQAVEMLRSLGRLAELPFEKPEIFEVPHSIPQGFSNAVLDGLALRKSPELNIEKFEAYAKSLDDQRLRLVLE